MKRVNEPIKVYTWGDYQLPGVVPMVWAYHPYGTNVDYGRPLPRTKTYHDPRFAVTEARRVAAWLRRRGEGERVLFFFRAGQTNTGLFSKSPAESIVHGPLIEPTRRWMREFFAALKNEGIDKLDYFVLDFEDGVSFWVESEAREQMWAELKRAHEQKLIELPDELLAIEPRQAGDWINVDRQLPVKFGKFVGDLRNNAIRKAIFEPMLEFFPGTPGSNYADTLRDFATADSNDWEEPVRRGPAKLIGTHSAPVTYISSGNRYCNLAGEELSRKKWTDARKRVQSALACEAPVAPWYGWPGYLDVPLELWREGLLADVQAGVRTLQIFGEARHWSAESRQKLAELLPQLQQLAAD